MADRLEFTIRSFAKINFFLDIISRNKSGFHGLRSVFSEISLHDKILIKITPSNDEILVKSDNKLIDDENNIIKQTAKTFNNISGIKTGYEFKIIKNIPIGGGLGGGSGNAGALLKFLNRYHKTNYSTSKLENISKEIGSDVPFFIKGKTQLIYGRGDIVKKINPVKYGFSYLAIIPRQKISTKEAYKLIDEQNLCKDQYENKKKFKKIVNAIKTKCDNEFINHIYNKFEDPIFSKYPELNMIKKAIDDTGTIKSFMSGSGSTIIAIFETRSKADSAKIKLINNKLIEKITPFTLT